jgi:hypothetical protein
MEMKPSSMLKISNIFKKFSAFEGKESSFVAFRKASYLFLSEAR